MGSLLPQLLATGLVGALAPVPVIIVVTLAMSKGGLRKAVGFALGLVVVYVGLGAIVLGTANAQAGGSPKGHAVLGTIIVVFGVVFLAMAIKQWLKAPDPDAAPPRFMDKLDTMGAAGAFVFGLVLALINIKQLGVYAAGVSQIVAAHLPTAQAWVALVLFLVAFLLVVLAVIVVDLVAHHWAQGVLNSFRGWLVRHNRTISIALGLIIGVGFVIKGIGQIAAA